MEIVGKFLSFDKLMGEGLVKFVYFLGLAGIALGVIRQIFASFGMMGASFGAGFWMLLMAPIGGIVAVLFWRFICELYIVLFKLGNDMSQVRATLTAKPDDASDA